MTKTVSALLRACEVAGGQKKLADRLGVSQGLIWYWLKKSKRVPAESALRIERVTGVSRSELRPDLWECGK